MELCVSMIYFLIIKTCNCSKIYHISCKLTEAANLFPSLEPAVLPNILHKTYLTLVKFVS